MKGENTIIEKPPAQEEIESYWQKIWGHTVRFNTAAKWLPDVKNNYCSGITGTSYEISEIVMKEVLSKTRNNKAPWP